MTGKEEQYFNDKNETPEHRKARLEGYYTKGTAAAADAAHNNDIAQHGVTNKYVPEAAFAQVDKTIEEMVAEKKH
jgi:hypothetical protein